MNKNLIALAVAGAFALPLAVSADTGNVVIYGKADIAVDQVNPGTSTVAGSESGNKRNRVTHGNSLLGFKGTEDLGNGLSAVFQFEQNVALDNGVAPGSGGSGGSTYNRSTFAGLSSATMGAVTLGIQDSPYKTATSGKLDPFADTIGDYNAIFTRDVRAANSVKYVSPNFSGFSVAAMWAAANEAVATFGAKSDGKFQSINGVYENGPIYVALAHERAQATGTTAAMPIYKANKLGGSYAFGDTKVGAIWEKYTDNATDFSGATVTTADDQNRRTNWTLNATHKIGATTLKAAYVKAGKQESVDNSNAKQWTLGASYAFSKRTEAYALYTRMDNRDGSSFGIGQGATAFAASGAGADPKGMALGLKHLF